MTKTKDKDYIYAFLHLPKTAGTTLKYHIIKSLKSDEHLHLSMETMGMEGMGPKLEDDDFAKYTDKYFSSADKSTVNKTRVIYGHGVIWGLQKYFDKPIRYITSVRHPIERTISLYNHLVDQMSLATKNKINRRELEVNLLIGGKVPDFEKWLEVKYDPDGNPHFLTMYGWLKWLGFLGKDANYKKQLDQAINKYYFIGLTKEFDKNLYFILEKMGIRKYFVDQNISKKHFVLGDNKNLRKKITDKNQEDMYLYEKSVEFNKKFKKDHEDYKILVSSAINRKKYLLPFTQALYAPLDTLRLINKKIL